METFIWTMLVIIGIESVVKIACLAVGFIPKRSSGKEALYLKREQFPMLIALCDQHKPK